MSVRAELPGVTRTARKRWECVCHREVRSWEVVRVCEHGTTTVPSLGQQEAERKAASLRGRPCHGGIVPSDDTIQVVPRRNPNHRSDCLGWIEPGDTYWEYRGEVAPWESGSRYCVPCATAVWGPA